LGIHTSALKAARSCRRAAGGVTEQQAAAVIGDRRELEGRAGSPMLLMNRASFSRCGDLAGAAAEYARSSRPIRETSRAEQPRVDSRGDHEPPGEEELVSVHTRSRIGLEIARHGARSDTPKQYEQAEHDLDDAIRLERLPCMVPPCCLCLGKRLEDDDASKHSANEAPGLDTRGIHLPTCRRSKFSTRRISGR